MGTLPATLSKLVRNLNSLSPRIFSVLSGNPALAINVLFLPSLAWVSYELILFLTNDIVNEHLAVAIAFAIPTLNLFELFH